MNEYNGFEFVTNPLFNNKELMRSRKQWLLSLILNLKQKEMELNWRVLSLICPRKKDSLLYYSYEKNKFHQK